MLFGMNTPDTARKTHLFACDSCRYTKEIGRSEIVVCPQCGTTAGLYRVLDTSELSASYTAAGLSPE